MPRLPQSRWAVVNRREVADGLGFAGPGEECFLLAVGQQCTDFRQHRPSGCGLTRVTGKKRFAAFMVMVFGVKKNPTKHPESASVFMPLCEVCVTGECHRLQFGVPP